MSLPPSGFSLIDVCDILYPATPQSLSGAFNVASENLFHYNYKGNMDRLSNFGYYPWGDHNSKITLIVESTSGEYFEPYAEYGIHGWITFYNPDNIVAHVSPEIEMITQVGWNRNSITYNIPEITGIPIKYKLFAGALRFFKVVDGNWMIFEKVYHSNYPPHRPSSDVDGYSWAESDTEFTVKYGVYPDDTGDPSGGGGDAYEMYHYQEGGLTGGQPGDNTEGDVPGEILF